MKKLGGILLVVAIAGLAHGDPYVGATLTTYDIASSDVPGPQPIRVFPVPAEAGWANSQIIYDNYAEGLGFSASQCEASVGDLDSYGRSPSDTAFYTNVEGAETDPGADNRFPYAIPRPGQWCGAWFSQIQIELTEASHKVGVFLPYHSNNWGSGMCLEDHNYNLQTNSFYVMVHGEGADLEDWSLAEGAWHSMKVGDGSYCPFLSVDSNGADKVQAVTIIHDIGQGSPTFGFMDIYVPEPATLLMLTAGVGLLIRRRRS